MKYNLKIINIIFVFVFLTGFIDFAFASITDGTIDSAYKYAWSENAGWINFGTSGGNIRITDSGLTGYAWSQNFGWINLSPTNSGVTNNGEGNLAGFAWGENLGWIDFDNVSINASGKFTGTASGDISGIITFNCQNCDVRTNWRPRSARPIGGGGGMLIAWLNPPKAPEGGFRVLINNNVKYTDGSIVTLNLFGGQEAARMAISNNPGFTGVGSTGQIPYQSSYQWNLCQGLISCLEGEYTVYVKFFASWGQPSPVVSDTIILDIIKEEPEKPFIERLPEILEPLIPDFLIPEEKEEELEEIIIIPKEAPLALQDRWRLLSPEPIERFVLAPLPNEIAKLAEKFPEFEKTLKEIGIAKITDIAKLTGARFSLPGLTEKVGLPTIVVEPGKFALPIGIPIAKLSPAVKEKIPTEIVFARTAGESIDFNIDLTITEEGHPIQKISTIADKPLQLVVKPEKPAKSIKGYLALAPQTMSQELRIMNESVVYNSRFTIQDIAASLIFVNPIFAAPPAPKIFVPVKGASISGSGLALKEDIKAETETRFVLLEFDYIDSDKDGIYTADIQTPVVAGEYEIITIIDYEDPEIGKREIRLITLIDPEGYIFERDRDRDREIRIPEAIVSLYWLNPETKQYELWPAEKFLQKNPQVTDVTGKYSFLVPEGFYYLKAEAPGYLIYEGKPFQVQEGKGVHINIELKTRYWWLEVIDWRNIVLIIFGVLLLYNFYRDKIKEGKSI